MKANEWKNGYAKRPQLIIRKLDEKDPGVIFCQVADNGTCEFLPIAFREVCYNPIKNNLPPTKEWLGEGRLAPCEAISLGKWLIETFSEEL